MKYCLLLLTVLIAFSCEKKKDPEIAAQMTGDVTLDKMTEQLAADPSNPELLFQRAQYLYEKENYEQAILDMFGAMKTDSLNADYHHFLADVYLDSYQSDLAMKTMVRVTKLYPKRIASLLKFSELQFILKQYDGSINSVNQVLAIEPQNEEAFFMLGLNFSEIGDIPRAINSLQTAVEIEPELLDAWLMLGKIYESKKDPKALTYYENALRIDSLSIEGLHSKAFYLQNNNRLDEAIDIYTKINRIDIDYIPAILNKGILFLEKDNIDRAWEEFNILCQRHPTSHIGFYYRGIVNEKKGEIQNAINDYQNSVNLKSDFTKGKEALEALKSAG